MFTFGLFVNLSLTRSISHFGLLLCSYEQSVRVLYVFYFFNVNMGLNLFGPVFKGKKVEFVYPLITRSL